MKIFPPYAASHKVSHLNGFAHLRIMIFNPKFLGKPPISQCF